MSDCRKCAYEHDRDACAGGPVEDDEECPGYQEECTSCGMSKCRCSELERAMEEGLM